MATTPSPSTPEQARELWDATRDLAMIHGTNYLNKYMWSSSEPLSLPQATVDQVAVPGEELGQYFPMVVYRKGTTQEDSPLGLVHFSKPLQEQAVPRDWITYQVIDLEELIIERTLHGKTAAIDIIDEAEQEVAKQEMLDELDAEHPDLQEQKAARLLSDHISEVVRHIAQRGEDRAASLEIARQVGLTAVTYEEADAVIDFLKQQNP